MEQFNNNNENEWSPSNPVYGTPVVKEGKKKKSFGKGIIVGVLVTVFVFVIGGLVAFSMLGKNTNLFSKATRTKLMMINQLLDKYYYDDIDDSDKIEGLYKGLVESANDPYTVYYTKDEFEDFQISTTGNYAGIGAVLQKILQQEQLLLIKSMRDLRLKRQDSARMMKSFMQMIMMQQSMIWTNLLNSLGERQERM